MPSPLPIAGAAGLALLAGCHFAGCHAAPRLDVTGVERLEQTADGYALAFHLEAVNANSFELPLLPVSYELWLDGERVFEGRRSGEATLSRQSAQALRLPVAVPLAPGQAPPVGLTPYRLRGTLRYATPGALSRSLFDAYLFRPSADFDIRGEIDFGLPDAAGPAAGRAGE